MEIARWKFWAVIAALAVMIVSHIIGESSNVSVATGNFFHNTSVVLFVLIVIGLIVAVYKDWKGR